VIIGRTAGLVGRALAPLLLVSYATLCVAHIEQPDMIDLVSVNKERAEVNLGIVQQNPWNARTFSLLDRKVRNYVSFVESGTMNRTYPETMTMHVVIEVAYFVEPDDRARSELRRLEAEIKRKNFGLRWFKLPGSK